MKTTTSLADEIINYDIYNYWQPVEISFPKAVPTAQFQDLFKWLKSRKSTFELVEDLINLEDEPCTLEDHLVAMANDPEIQSEIKIINDEFAITEFDGLEKF